MTPVLLVISAVFMLVYLFFIRYIAGHWSLTNVPGIKVDLPAVSILIPARNEAQNIARCLTAIQNQGIDHMLIEVIMIDDFSEDETMEIARSFQSVLNLKLLKSDAPGKKQALQTGLAQASHNIIVTSDADCTMGKDWLRTMLTEFTGHDLNMLCGLVRLEASGIFQELQQAESAAIVGISAVMLNEQQPCTCNGANLMFRKDIFEHVGGYQSHELLSSGDDDLLMQRFAGLEMSRTRYMVHPDAIVETTSCPDFSSLLAQRSRWLSKRKAYIFPYNQLVQVMVLLQLLAFYCLVVLLFMPHAEYAILLIVLKYLADLYYGRKIRKVIKFRLLMILLMPFYQLYIFMVLVYARFSKQEWKGRVLAK